MSNTDKDKEFYEMADAFIAIANKQGKNTNSLPAATGQEKAISFEGIAIQPFWV